MGECTVKNARQLITALLLAAAILGTAGCQPGSRTPVVSGPWLGQTTPSTTPVPFATGLVTTGHNELNAAFSPAGDEFYWTMADPFRQFYVIMRMELGEDGRWSEPEVAPWSGGYSDADPFFSVDGQRIYFVSRRPLDGEGPPKDFDIWYVEREGEGWSAPVNLGPEVNGPSHEYYVTVTAEGTVYFSAEREGGMGSFDVYRVPRQNGGYGEAENLGPAINSPGLEADAFITPDESMLIFSAWNREDGVGHADLYLSRRRADGTWTEAVNLGPEINSPRLDYCPILSPDGSWFFYTSYRLDELQQAERRTRDELLEAFRSPGNGLGDVFWVDAAVLDDIGR